MTPTDMLREEHRVVTLVLDAAARYAVQTKNRGIADAAYIERMLDFFRGFVDRCHHTKEEQHLFVMLEARGIGREDGPIGVMLAEHEQGRQLVAAMTELLPGIQRGDVATTRLAGEKLGGYAALLRGHIRKEESVLFPMGDEVLTPGDARQLTEAFEQVEREATGEGGHEKYHALARELAGVEEE